MTANIGTTDRAIRIVAGLVLLSLLFLLTGPVRWVGLIGIIPLVTAMVRICPLYSLLGIRTCPLSTSAASHS
ncbi:MAG TPA: DUF2892 domain-containing protein, partial [Rhodopila sp.]|nr:DUF2892 domain-containing protein [Rhodopila sp.]